MRESDTGLWLHNKLGATDELWAPPSIASLLTAAVIDNIRLCFHGLSSAVKLKLLLGTLHLPRRTVDEVRRRRGPTPGPGFPRARRPRGAGEAAGPGGQLAAPAPRETAARRAPVWGVCSPPRRVTSSCHVNRVVRGPRGRRPNRRCSPAPAPLPR